MSPFIIIEITGISGQKTASISRPYHAVGPETVGHSMGIQDPKMEVLYHIRPYFVGIFPYIGL